MKKILVTGGAGFVGSNLCERLSKIDGNDIYSLDNYFTGSVDNHVDNVTYIKGSTIDIADLITFIPDVIFHLGEYSRVEQSFEDVEKVLEFNKLGTLKVLEFVRKNRSKLIYAGSSTKFGDGGANADATPYAWSKSSNTQLVINYGEWFDIDYAITYFYNVYGNREIKYGKYATLIALFSEKYKKNEPFTVVSPGSQLRNFTHIDDTVDALILIGENGSGDGYGIANPKAYSVLDVAKIFGGQIEMLPERNGNRMVASVIGDKTIALGWNPIKCLESYISALKSQ